MLCALKVMVFLETKFLQFAYIITRKLIDRSFSKLVYVYCMLLRSTRTYFGDYCIV